MISIIIPCYNEEAFIGSSVKKIMEKSGQYLVTEIIIADGGSEDQTLNKAINAGAIGVVSPVKGRSAQMNFGASLAKGEILYFLHADTLPPENFSADIMNAVQNGFEAGCFMLAFDVDHWFLKANCWFTRFNVNAVRFGDQSLFVTKEKFVRVGGFCEKHIVMEDQEIIRRLSKICSLKVIRKYVITSARKYLENGIFRTQAIFCVIYFMYQFGYSQARLVSTYKKLMRQNKL